MPRRCCVPGCKSNYKNAAEYTSVFSFPKEEALRAKWIQQIHRKDFIPSGSSVVCIKHFVEKFIERQNSAKRPDGTILSITRKIPVLSKDAYPSIFENQPSYHTTKPQDRQTPSARFSKLQARDEEKFQEWLEVDKIASFQDFQLKFQSKLPDNWIVLYNKDKIVIAQVDITNAPTLVVSLEIKFDLKIMVWHNGYEVHSTKFSWLLGSALTCNRWSIFESLVSHLSGYSKKVNTCTKLEVISSLLKQCAHECEEDKMKKKIEFLQEQFCLSVMVSPRYSPQMLLWSFILFFTHPSAYRSIRNSFKLTLPHPVYLKKMLQNLGNLQSGSESTQIRFLTEKTRELTEREKIVGCMFDEIYVKPGTFYKGGRIEGLATNNLCEASTVQAFMVSSVFSKHKEIVGLYPMKNQNADDLFQIIQRLLRILHQIGYKVIFLISDNNRVNRKMYETMCKGTLKSSIPNPAAINEKLFLLFDTVHLLKSIRNNWLNQKETNQTFFVPSMTLISSGITPCLTSSSALTASILHLKHIYHKEIDDVVKVAPSLNRKSLFPTNLERQNVGHAVRLFDEKLIPALEFQKPELGNDVNGTIHFIDIISKWWKIVNVKHPRKGQNLRDPYSEPIKDIWGDDDNLEFLKHFCNWLEQWEALQSSIPIFRATRHGKLSKETFYSLFHTTRTLICLSEYLLDELSTPAEYVLLGKFQTDCLEARFGQYRSMSGGNYNISITQILETERKLKIINLMSLTSAKLGQFKIKTFLKSCNEPQGESEDSVSDFFLNAIQLSDGIKLTDSNKKALIYICGYVARVAAEGCSSCREKLTLNSVMEFETADVSVKTYLSVLDRGGLFWPNDFTVSICFSCYQLFQIFISEDFEEKFLLLKNQKSLLIDLTEEKLEQNNIYFNWVCTCGKNSKSLMYKAVSSMSNILLNNYCKMRNEKSIAKSLEAKSSKQSALKAKKDYVASQKDAPKSKKDTLNNKNKNPKGKEDKPLKSEVSVQSVVEEKQCETSMHSSRGKVKRNGVSSKRKAIEPNQKSSKRKILSLSQ